MVNPDGEGVPDELDRIADDADVIRDGWQRTVEDTRAMAADREDAGYETLVVFSQDTSPVAPDAEGAEHWGLTYLVDGDTAETVVDARERAEFDETAVYQAGAGPTTFIVTECLDHDEELVVFVAGAFRKREATGLVRAATERGEMHTHFRTLDGTVIASVEHDDVSAFFPDPQEYYSYGGQFTADAGSSGDDADE
jgi:hypothetical protein